MPRTYLRDPSPAARPGLRTVLVSIPCPWSWSHFTAIENVKFGEVSSQLVLPTVCSMIHTHGNIRGSRRRHFKNLPHRG